MSITAVGDTSRQIVEFLLKIATFPQFNGKAQLIETHISWLFLTEKHVYKLKKPIRLGFLDFSTPQLRRHACEDEVRLNRRLSPDVYLGVIPISRNQQGEFSLHEAGEAIDWMVQMRRLPEDKSLDHLLRTGRLQATDEDAISQRLIAFFAKLTPVFVKPDEYRCNLENHIRGNEQDLIGIVSSSERIWINRIVGNQLRYLHVQAPLFHARVKDGRLVDGHGDLRPEHIYAESPPSIIDCIEFSAELRRNDVADELSFLAMECDRIGRSEFGNRIFAAYAAASGDNPPTSLIAFYKSYRAVVRAKVALIRMQQGAEASRPSLLRQVHHYLTWADHYAAQLGRPSVVAVGGLMGTGKSTLANRLSTLTGAELLSSDSVRRKMFGVSQMPIGYGEKLYRPENRELVYETLFNQAAELLDRGLSVILDATFSSAQQRSKVVSLSQQHGGIPLFVLCQCPKSTALTRIAARAAAGTGNSEARVDLYDLQAADFEPLHAEFPCVQVDSTGLLVQQSGAVFHKLGRLLRNSIDPELESK